MDETRRYPANQELEGELETIIGCEQPSAEFTSRLEQKIMKRIETSTTQTKKNETSFLAWLKPAIPALAGGAALIVFAALLIWGISRLTGQPGGSGVIPAAAQTEPPTAQSTETIGMEVTPTAEAVSGDDFGIYLLEGDVKVSEVFQQGVDLASLELQAQPVISGQDIVAYHRDTYEMEITSEAAQRLADLHVPTDGIPFVVCVGSDRIYAGAFWTSLSSASFDGTVIDVTLIGEENKIRFQVGYPGPDFFQGEDLRNDPAILDALERAGVVE